VSTSRPAAPHHAGLKDWLLVIGVAFGVGLIWSWLWHRHLLTAAQIGGLTIPPVLLSVVLLHRQRHKLVAQQTAAARTRLRKLQKQVQQTSGQLRRRKHHPEPLAPQPQEFQDLTLQQLQLQRLQLETQHWQQTLETQQQKCQDYEDYLAELDQKCWQSRATSLELTKLLNERRQQAQELETDIDYRQTLVHKLASRYQQLQQQQALTKRTWQTAQAELNQLQTDMQAQTSQHSIRQIELEQQIPELEQRWETLKIGAVSKEIEVRQLEQQTLQLEDWQAHLTSQVTELNELISQKQTLFEQVDRTLAEHQQVCQERKLELQQLETNIEALKSERLAQEQELLAESTQLSSGSWPNLISFGESFSSHEIAEQFAELSKLGLPHPSSAQPQLSQSWSEQFIDNPHLEVLRHIEAHGVITEAEVANLLGNPRLARQFANKLSEYVLLLPFAIRVEATSTGSRYLKENKYY
jgi:DNA repair exonuclease SbcCD ATPase subunit